MFRSSAVLKNTPSCAYVVSGGTGRPSFNPNLVAIDSMRSTLGYRSFTDSAASARTSADMPSRGRTRKSMTASEIGAFRRCRARAMLYSCPTRRRPDGVCQLLCAVSAIRMPLVSACAQRHPAKCCDIGAREYRTRKSMYKLSERYSGSVNAVQVRGRRTPTGRMEVTDAASMSTSPEQHTVRTKSALRIDSTRNMIHSASRFRRRAQLRSNWRAVLRELHLQHDQRNPRVAQEQQVTEARDLAVEHSELHPQRTH